MNWTINNYCNHRCVQLTTNNTFTGFFDAFRASSNVDTSNFSKPPRVGSASPNYTNNEKWFVLEGYSCQISFTKFLYVANTFDNKNLSQTVNKTIFARIFYFEVTCKKNIWALVKFFVWHRSLTWIPSQFYQNHLLVDLWTTHVTFF